ncbi:MAG: hypothetical protein ACK4HV_06915 [Parachlamydiaceae bacterium]
MNKITDKFLSLPPYISVSWREVAFVKSEGDLMVISLKTGEICKIPNLTEQEKNLIFECHRHFLEQPEFPKHSISPIGFKIGTPEGVFQAFEHNPELSNSPNIPDEVLDKIVESTAALPQEQLQNLPLGEEGCNCFFCQIMNAIHGKEKIETIESIDEVVDEEELTFREWDIVQTGDKLYSVTNANDPTEKYTVFLGDPIGCTCGKNQCEHILSVLKS